MASSVHFIVSHQGYGCFSGFLMSMYVCHLLSKGVVMPSMNNYQVMRHTLINLSQYTPIFLGSVLSFLAPCCLSWLLAVLLGSWLSFLAPCLSFSRSFSSLSFFLPFFLLVLLFCFVCIVYANYSKVCVCVCVCVCV